MSTVKQRDLGDEVVIANIVRHETEELDVGELGSETPQQLFADTLTNRGNANSKRIDNEKVFNSLSGK
eukprot:CAMPEP_0185569388 /NCGR_PEP_ID=MMETSP0434-20130131/2026_1 /TAXON_ID=626734 ORGANISM="Favella taraikaensis, Strain Fe Narragansett Bay" /NCGR_SAMPLE_ID=MMETSP0434 /ASSEMBLY_ACC=CAM_ASM_000379 /LENGTH=67 /DNA_ID=CAMNT_0028184155 /DNA_START=107 /DNA_END=310 /DNA_ORIENTATION=-